MSFCYEIVTSKTDIVFELSLLDLSSMKKYLSGKQKLPENTMCLHVWMANKAQAVLIKFFFKTDFSIIKKKSSSKFVVDFALNYVNRHVVFLIAMTQQPHPQIL